MSVYRISNIFLVSDHFTYVSRTKFPFINLFNIFLKPFRVSESRSGQELQRYLVEVLSVFGGSIVEASTKLCYNNIKM